MSALLNDLPRVVDEARVRAALPELDTRGALERMFRSLADGRAVQPPQTLTLFPDIAVATALYRHVTRVVEH